ncbi:hypothetical protein FJZ53_05805 [Candidatus Woesearchaeota archaeon]|nr:hypothetical protein [Candidatus Woesearchaeota archaeon]
MATLYEILNELAGDDVTQKYSPQKIADISDEIKKKVEKRIGSTDYQALETYVTNHKSDQDLKDITMYIIAETGLKIAALAVQSNNSNDRSEVLLGYKIAVKLNEVLKSAHYDAELALLDIWDSKS